MLQAHGRKELVSKLTVMWLGHKPEELCDVQLLWIQLQILLYNA